MFFLFTAFIDYFIFFGWRDIIEISFFSTLFYYFSLWLHTDTKKNLLFTFYGYWFITFSAYALQLHSITFFLFTTAPIALMLFILVHQEFLQRNFITLKNALPATSLNNDWLDLLMRICLHTINKNKEILVIVEQQDSLAAMLHTSFYINTPLDQTLLTLLIDAHSFDQTKFIWVNKQGQLLGINAVWKYTIAEEWVDKNVQRFEQWQHDALALSNKTDALIFGVSPVIRTFSIITQGKTFEHLQGAAALRMIKKFLSISPALQKGIVNDYIKKQPNHEINA
jgi:hypothetical protein